MTPERAKSATPAQPRSLPKPFPEAPHHQPTTKCLQNNPERPPDQARNTDPTLP